MNVTLRNKSFEDTVSGVKDNYECWFYGYPPHLKRENIIDENFVFVFCKLNQNLERIYVFIRFYKTVNELFSNFSENELNKYSIFIIPVTNDNHEEIIKDIKNRHQSILST